MLVLCFRKNENTYFKILSAFFSFLFFLTFICRGNFQFYFWAFHLHWSETRFFKMQKSRFNEMLTPPCLCRTRRSVGCVRWSAWTPVVSYRTLSSSATRWPAGSTHRHPTIPHPGLPHSIWSSWFKDFIPINACLTFVSLVIYSPTVLSL